MRRRCNRCKLQVPHRLKFSGKLLDNAYESTEELVAPILVAPRCCSEMCSLCRLCGVAPALCPAWPGPVRLTPSNPRNYRIAESPNRRGAHFDRIANREALPRDSARFGQPWSKPVALLVRERERRSSRPDRGRSAQCGLMKGATVD